MTTARTGSVYVEAVGIPTIIARTGSVYVEAVGIPTVVARTGSVYIEVVVTAHPPPPGEWSVGSIRM